MKLIDADALYRRIKTECNPYGKPTIDFESGNRVLDIIDNAPTVEPTFGVFKAICCEECDKRPQASNNAELFKQTFGIYATEVWAMKEADFLKWLNAEVDE